MNLNGKEYFYIRNVQNDVIGLHDSTGTVVVNYSYDTWGNIVSITGSLKDSVGVKNPYRYRGYRYDEETGMYYLQSRYYNAEWGRFINADGIVGIKGELLSHNIFMYCNNNAINMCDKSGRFPAIIPFLPAIGKVLGAAILTLGATLVGGLIGNKINYIQRDKAVNKVVTKEAEKSKNDKKKGTIIYRYGNYTNKNLTPREKDKLTGLSFSTRPPLKGKAVVTTTESINSTGKLMAVKDGINHVSVRPVNCFAMQEWINSRDNAEESPHEYTITLKEISWEYKVGK